MAQEGSGVETIGAFGELLRHLRQRARLTQDEFGLAVGYSRAHVARLESGQRAPDLSTVRARFAEALGLQNEPRLAARLIELAMAARDEPAVDGIASSPSAPQAPNNLPIQVTSFVGRVSELAELRHQLLPAPHSSMRLQTLTGAGGTGKTRLALQLAADMLDAGAYPGGIWLVELAALADSALVPQAIAAVLHLHEEPEHSISETLLDALRALDKPLLLLLDNCEHVIDTCAHFAEAVLRNCPRVTILATSREDLSIAGERVWRVPTLQTPDARQAIPLAGLADYEAVHLFVDRARAVLPSFSLSESNATAVQQIVARLDGMPLAIELAAARAGVMSVEDIAARLRDRFRLLTSSSRTAPPRQQTLRATIDWSYDLLTVPERALFRRLAVFAGGWTLEAAEATCGDTLIEPADVLDLLARLVRQSLVVMVTGAGGVTGLTRYHLLETIRQYALEKLSDAREEELARRRHLVYFIALGEAVAAEWSALTTEDPASLARRLDLDFENVRHALDWAAETGQVDDAIHLIEALWTTLTTVRPLDMELLRWLHRLVALPTAPRNARLGRAYLMIWELYFGQDQLAQAQVANEQAHAIGVALEDTAILARADYQWALQAQERGDYILARSIFDRLLAAGERTRDDWSWVYGILALYEGKYPQARDHLLEGYMRLHARTSSKAYTAGSGRLLGHALAYLGDYAAAAPLLRDSLLDNREMGDERGVAASLAAYGALAVARSEWRRAARLFGAAEGLIESVHDFLQYFDRMLFRRNVTALRERLDAASLSEEWAAGRAMTLDQAVAFALDV